MIRTLILAAACVDAETGTTANGVTAICLDTSDVRMGMPVFQAVSRFGRHLLTGQYAPKQ
ncbi:hypothetical protein UG46_04330 [Pseudomonas fluorescens]|uniref:Uncharacterized protein n=1 Tax=Pseudomonas frederiksbergensis TaxID=104087 RepID=A0A0B1YUP6_9PSED|nr:hypothetical protein JZ00_23275 [Pseudomonas frederiksbergensis]KJH88050.1 hypothetical protein UG46_04330 [Pseudomonas fluorescens]